MSTEQEHPPEGKLHLRPGAVLFDIAADRLQISFPNYTATFTSPPVAKGIRALLKELETPGERSELVHRASVAAEMEPEFIDYLIAIMLQSNCLYLETTPVAEAQESPLVEFYASIGEDPGKVVEKLGSARPLVVSPIADAEKLSEALRSGGIAGEVVAIPPGITCEDGLAEVKARIPTGSRLLVSWNFAYRLPFTRFLNSLSFEMGIPALFGACEGIIGRIGPYIIPRNTACLECYNRRLLAHSGEPELQAFQQYRIRYQDSIPAAWPKHPNFNQATLEIFALEVAHIVSDRPPRTIGSVIEYSYADITTRHHPVYRIPRCEICHSGRPQRVPWSVQFPAPTVKDGSE